MDENLIRLLSDLKEKDTLRLVEERLRAGVDPLRILEDSRRAMEIVGQRFSQSIYFIPDLIYSAKILEQVAERVKPRM